MHEKYMQLLIFGLLIIERVLYGSAAIWCGVSSLRHRLTKSSGSDFKYIYMSATGACHETWVTFCNAQQASVVHHIVLLLLMPRPENWKPNPRVRAAALLYAPNLYLLFLYIFHSRRRQCLMTQFLFPLIYNP